MIYLDANATTPVDPAVVEAMLPFLTTHYGNPSAAHAAGRYARKAVEKARGQVAHLIHADADEIIFTSAATESINSVHLSVQQTWPNKPLLIISATEHAATQAAAQRWETNGGRVKIIPVHPSGLLKIEALQAALEPGATALVSILWGNNETGVIQPMRQISSLAHEAGAWVHTDAVQMLGKAPVDVADSGVDFLSLSGHKMHAPKGIGALFVSRKVSFHPLLVGGGQESGQRSGTENVPGIVAMGKAAELAHLSLQNENAHPSQRDLFEALIQEALPEIHIHGKDAPRLPNTSSICFPGVDATALIIRLDQKGVACSGGSACHTGTLHPSHVLEAMSYDARHAASTLRFSLSRFNTEEEIRKAAQIVIAAVQHLREQWDPNVVVSFS